jgi:hypothetical protein
MQKMFSKLCTPAKIYFAIAVIASIIGLVRGMPFGVILFKMIFAFAWTFVLGWLCKKGFSYLSWFLVLLPYVVILLAMFGIARITQHKPIFRSLGIQGAYGQEAMGTMDKSMDEMDPTDTIPMDKKKKA